MLVASLWVLSFRVSFRLGGFFGFWAIRLAYGFTSSGSRFVSRSRISFASAYFVSVIGFDKGGAI